MKNHSHRLQRCRHFQCVGSREHYSACHSIVTIILGSASEKMIYFRKKYCLLLTVWSLRRNLLLFCLFVCFCFLLFLFVLCGSTT